MAYEVDQEGSTKVAVDAFIGQQIADIEEIPRMLAVQCRNDFSGVKVRERYDLNFGKAERLFDRC